MKQEVVAPEAPSRPVAGHPDGPAHMTLCAQSQYLWWVDRVESELSTPHTCRGSGLGGASYLVPGAGLRSADDTHTDTHLELPLTPPTPGSEDEPRTMASNYYPYSKVTLLNALITCVGWGGISGGQSSLVGMFTEGHG